MASLNGDVKGAASGGGMSGFGAAAGDERSSGGLSASASAGDSAAAELGKKLGKATFKDVISGAFVAMKEHYTDPKALAKDIIGGQLISGTPIAGLLSGGLKAGFQGGLQASALQDQMGELAGPVSANPNAATALSSNDPRANGDNASRDFGRMPTIDVADPATTEPALDDAPAEEGGILSKPYLPSIRSVSRQQLLKKYGLL